MLHDILAARNLPNRPDAKSVKTTILITLLLTAVTAVFADDWPQWGGPRRDGVWREDGIVDVLTTGALSLRWRAPLGAGYSGPAVTGGRVFVMDRPQSAPLPLPPSADAKKKKQGPRASVGNERVVCLSDTTGEILWTCEYPTTYTIGYPSGPRVTPTVDGGRVFTLGAMGDLHCLEAETGRVLWRKNAMRDYGAKPPTWGWASNLLVDGQRLIGMIGGEGSAVVAFDTRDGRELWRALTARQIGYCPPMIFELCGRRQLVIWHGEALNGLEPETGRVLWSVPFDTKSGMAISVPAVKNDRIWVSCQMAGAMMVDLSGGLDNPRIVWQHSTGAKPEIPFATAGLNTVMSTLLWRDGYLYGVSLYGEFACLKADTGERVWTTLAPTSGGTEPRDRWSTAFLIPHQNRILIFNELGDLIAARLSSQGYEELSRVHLIDADMLPGAGPKTRRVVWSHPAFANRSVYARNDHELLCVSMRQ